MSPTLSDADRDRLAAATNGTRPFALKERAAWTALEPHYPRPDREVIRAALTSPGKPDHPRPGAHGRAEAAKRYGARTR